MLSYRHAFHAGNHADVLKHLVLVQLTRYLAQKDKPFWYIDTHSGAGAYALDAAYAQKLAEYKEGIGRLWGRNDLPAALADYVDLVRRLNPDRRLLAYPGSPYLRCGPCASRIARASSSCTARMRVCCRNVSRDAGRQVIVEPSDGFAGLKALLPPPPRRALVLVDPSYEDKRDYERFFTNSGMRWRCFPGGTYALWYPQLTRLDAHELPQRLKRLPAKGWLHVALRVREPAKDGFGMHGSGMFIRTRHGRCTRRSPK